METSINNHNNMLYVHELDAVVCLWKSVNMSAYDKWLIKRLLECYRMWKMFAVVWAKSSNQ